MTVTRRAFNASMNTSGTSTTTITINRHTDLTDGELLVAVTNGPIGTVTAPAGWTKVGEFVDGTATQSNMYKKIASSEPANWTWTFPSSSCCGVSVTAFIGGYDILTWDANTTGAGTSLSARRTDAARDSLGYAVCCWADTASDTLTVSQGSEEFDIAAANTGSTLFRGIGASLYGPGVAGINDIVNIGDGLPGTTFTASGAVTGAVVWQFLIDNRAPDTETWSSTNGDFAVELELDKVEIDALGGIETVFRGDVTGSVATITASGENLPNEGVAKLADGLESTKWLVFADLGWAQYDFGAGNAKTIRRYRLTSANDAADRDPMDWVLRGSNNGVDFTALDTRDAIAFAARGEVQEFRVTTPGSYRYYRLDISSNRGPTSVTSTQLAEWRLSTHDVWEDITTYVNEESKIRITRGLQGSSGRSDFTRAYAELNNTDGRFSLENSDGAYYGSLQRNTQMRISKAYGTKSLQLQGDVQVEGTNMCGDSVSTALTTLTTITGDIDIRIDLEPESWHDEQALCGIGVNPSADEGWGLFIDDVGVLHLTWHDGAASFNDVSSEFAVPQDSARQAVRVTLDVNDGAGGHIVTFYTSDTISGTWTQLGDAITRTGTTSIGYTGGNLAVGHVKGRSQRGIHGLVYHFELRSGIGGSLASDLDFTGMVNGVHSFTDTVGSTPSRWIMVNNAIVSNRRYRFHGEVAEWPIAWDPTGTWITASVTGAGVQKRLERGNSPLSAMRRFHTKGLVSDPGAFERHAEPANYWPLEDQKNSFAAASAIPSKPGMQVYGSVIFEHSEGDQFKESDTLPRLNLGKFGGRVTNSTSGYADIRWLHSSPTGMADGAVVMEIFSTGAVRRWTVTQELNDTWRVRGYDEDDSGSSAWDSGNRALTSEGELMHVQLLLDDSGANVSVTMTAYDIYGTSLGTWTDSFLVANVGKVTRINMNPFSDIGASYVGHVAVYGVDSPPFAPGANNTVFNAHHYETAGERIKRICAEEDIEFRYVGALGESSLMGYQNIDTPFAIVSTSAVTDDGYLIDPLDAFGIEYRTGRSLYNQPAALTLSYSGNDLSNELRPTEDDSYIVNDFTASRGDAGSARFQRTDGKLSVENPPDGVGPYEQSQSYSLAHEGQCVDIASWQVHKGTLNEERYPRIELALENLRIAASSTKTENLLKLDVGKRVDITDPPDFLVQNDIRQIVIGYEEWFDKFQHNFKLNTIPERIFEVARYDAWSHHDSDGSGLYQDVTSSATTLDFQTNTGPAWTSDVESMPFDVKIDGEVIRVHAPGDLINTNPYANTTVSDWTTQFCSVARNTTVVHPHPTAVASVLVTPDGSGSTANAFVPETSTGSITPQHQYKVAAWVYSPTGYTQMQTRVNWHDSAGAYISTSTGTYEAVPAAVWTYIERTYTAPALASRARAMFSEADTPAAGDTFHLWALRITEVRSTATASYSGDSFNRADSTTTPGSTDRGTISAWTEDTGTWGIQTNRAYITANADSIMSIPGNANLELLQVETPVWTSGTVHLVFRMADTSNYIRWGGTVGAAPACELIEAAAVTRTVTASSGSDFTLVAGDTLAVRTSGSIIECYRNGVLALCFSDTSLSTNTRVGLRLTTNVPRLDDFYVEAAGALQTYSVERGINNAATTHKSGAEIKLYQQPYRGM